jgi:hypothetical protein
MYNKKSLYNTITIINHSKEIQEDYCDSDSEDACDNNNKIRNKECTITEL